MAHGDFKGLIRRTSSDNILRDKAFNIDKNLKSDGYQRGPASMVEIFFGKNTSGGGVKNENLLNMELTKELHKPIIRNLKNQKYTQLL